MMPFMKLERTRTAGPIGYDRAVASGGAHVARHDSPIPTLARFVLAVSAFVCAAASAAERYWPPIVDPATGVHHPGRWVWGDLVTSDVGTAAKFYADVGRPDESDSARAEAERIRAASNSSR